MAQRPLVAATIRTEFGDVLDDPSFYDVGGSDRDLTHVPGFSEMRRNRDNEIALVASGKKPAHEAKISPLPVNLHWTRANRVKGDPDGTEQVAMGNLGYRLVNESHIGKEPWITALPAGATVDADGSIRKGDTILMVADAKTAARSAARNAFATQRLSDAAQSAAGGLIDVAGRARGADPFVKKEN